MQILLKLNLQKNILAGCNTGFQSDTIYICNKDCFTALIWNLFCMYALKMFDSLHTVLQIHCTQFCNSLHTVLVFTAHSFGTSLHTVLQFTAHSFAIHCTQFWFHCTQFCNSLHTVLVFTAHTAHSFAIHCTQFCKFTAQSFAIHCTQFCNCKCLQARPEEGLVSVLLPVCVCDYVWMFECASL